MRFSLIYGILVIMAVLVIQTDAIKCHIKTIRDELSNGLRTKENDVQERYCDGSCVSNFMEGKLDKYKVRRELGICNKKGKENFINAASINFGRMYGYQCDTHLCNNKENFKYEQTVELQRVVDTVAAKLEGKSRDLKCYDETGTSADCEGVCVIERNYTDATAEFTKTSCAPSFTEYFVDETAMGNKTMGDHGLIVGVIYVGKVKNTSITAYCSKTNCNEKNSLDEEFAEIVAKTSVSTAVMPVLLIFSAMLNM